MSKKYSNIKKRYTKLNTLPLNPRKFHDSNIIAQFTQHIQGG